jgi:hypothetical protein
MDMQSNMTKKCLRCGRQWLTRSLDKRPQKCPSCGSLYWDIERKPPKGVRRKNYSTCPNCVPGTRGLHKPGCEGIVRLANGRLIPKDVYGSELTESQQTDLLDRARVAWDLLAGARKAGKFGWRGGEYVVSKSPYRLMVHTMQGKPVVSRYDED